MHGYYVRAPQIFQPIKIYKGNIVVEKANANSVPPDYRKNKIAQIKSALYEIEWKLKIILKRTRKENSNDY